MEEGYGGAEGNGGAEEDEFGDDLYGDMKGDGVDAFPDDPEDDLGNGVVLCFQRATDCIIKK